MPILQAVFQRQKHIVLSLNDDAMPQIQGAELFKMYPTLTKSKAKDFMWLGEKSRKIS